MMNAEKMRDLTERYYRNAAAHVYCLGFFYENSLYSLTCKDRIPENFLRLTRASSNKGGMLKVRLRFNNAMKAKLIANGIAQLIGPASLMADDGKHNKGERFEQVIFEKATGLQWRKDSTPFYIAGDMTYRQAEVQIKFEEATVVDEKVLVRHEA